jgi:hypothetical protein
MKKQSRIKTIGASIGKKLLTAVGYIFVGLALGFLGISYLLYRTVKFIVNAPKSIYNGLKKHSRATFRKGRGYKRESNVEGEMIPLLAIKTQAGKQQSVDEMLKEVTSEITALEEELKIKETISTHDNSNKTPRPDIGQTHSSQNNNSKEQLQHKTEFVNKKQNFISV